VFGIISPFYVIIQLLLNKNIIYFKYKKFKLALNNDSINSVTYHIINSTPKIEKMVNEIDHCKTAVDIGANNGLFSFFLKKRFPDAKVFIFEPSNSLIKLIKLNLNNLNNIVIEQKAVSNIDGEVTFFVNPHSEQTNSIDFNSVIKGNISSLNKNITEIKVESITLDSYFQNLDTNIDVLKVDIQGAEYKMLLGAKKTIKIVKKAFFEISFLDSNFFETLTELKSNFSNYKVINEVKMGADIMFIK
jgi:FkbM family methyltransferase